MDSLQDCNVYKEFLDRITPQDHFDRAKNREGDDEEEDRYFKDPNQILEIFGNLIEENLLFI